jgi:ribonuclease D
MDAPFHFIATADGLAGQLERWAAVPWLAVDTEFVREETYFAQLCLVQLSDGVTHVCVDALAVDLAPLFAFLQRPQPLKLFHSAGQDLELFAQRGGDCPRPVFDTQIAAALLGHGEQLGYAALVERRLGLAVDKTLSRTDWSKRPLSDAQLAYAADDVRHLAALYPALREELARRGRLAWLEAECARLTELRRYQPDAAGAWRGVKGLARLPAAAQHRAARLARWREEEALRRNRPRRWILDDLAVCQVALRAPQTLAALSDIEGVSAKLVQRAGDALLALVNEPVPDAPPLVAEQRDTPAQKAQIQGLLDLLRNRAQAEEIAPTLVATRGDIERLVREGPAAPIPLLSGWRRELLGEELLGKL